MVLQLWHSPERPETLVSTTSNLQACKKLYSVKQSSVFYAPSQEKKSNSLEDALTNIESTTSSIL